MDRLLQHQDRLQKEAVVQLKELNLLKMLHPYGRVVEVGSSATGLMCWPDIDIEVVVNKMPAKADIAQLGVYLFSKDDVVRVWLMDNTEKLIPHQPQGLYLGAKRKVGETFWKFDMWFLLEGTQSGKDDVEWINKAMTPHAKRAILQIKQDIYDNPKYRKQIFSYDIYTAVLKEGITSLSGFKKYLAKTGRNL